VGFHDGIEPYEKPEHPISIRSHGRREVTFAEWNWCVDTGARKVRRLKELVAGILLCDMSSWSADKMSARPEMERDQNMDVSSKTIDKIALWEFARPD
jgi:hypothetical protein